MRGIGYLRLGARTSSDVVLKSERRHAGHRRRRRARGAVAHAAARRRRLERQTRGRSRASSLLRRGENPSRVLDGVHEQGRRAERQDPAEGHADRAVLRPHDAGRATRSARCTTTCCTARCWSSPWCGCSCAASRLADRRVGDPARAARRVHRPVRAIDLPANLISMGAIDFGILVDGAVVLVENVMHEAQHAAAGVAPRAAAAHRPLRDRRGAADVLRDGDHHRRADPGVHAAARRGPHLPAARADLQLRAARRAGVRADRSCPRCARSCCGRATRELREPRWIERMRAAATGGWLGACARRGARVLRSARGSLLVARAVGAARGSAPSSCPSSTRATS